MLQNGSSLTWPIIHLNSSPKLTTWSKFQQFKVAKSWKSPVVLHVFFCHGEMHQAVGYSCTSLTWSILEFCEFGETNWDSIGNTGYDWIILVWLDWCILDIIELIICIYVNIIVDMCGNSGRYVFLVASKHLETSTSKLASAEQRGEATSTGAYLADIPCWRLPVGFLSWWYITHL